MFPPGMLTEFRLSGCGGTVDPNLAESKSVGLGWHGVALGPR